MEKEIKFSAWDKKRKKMFLVKNIKFNHLTGLPLEIELYSMGFENWLDEKRNYNRSEEYYEELIFTNTAENLKDVILLRYTGLKDKNGVEINEGDIIKTLIDKNDIVSKPEYLLIKFEKGAFITDKDWDCGNFNLSDGLDLDNKWINDIFEVIGNIYSNPELL